MLVEAEAERVCCVSVTGVSWSVGTDNINKQENYHCIEIARCQSWRAKSRWSGSNSKLLSIFSSQKRKEKKDTSRIHRVCTESALQSISQTPAMWKAALIHLLTAVSTLVCTFFNLYSLLNISVSILLGLIHTFIPPSFISPLTSPLSRSSILIPFSAPLHSSYLPRLVSPVVTFCISPPRTFDFLSSRHPFHARDSFYQVGPSLEYCSHSQSTHLCNLQPLNPLRTNHRLRRERTNAHKCLYAYLHIEGQPHILGYMLGDFLSDCQNVFNLVCV